MGFTGAEGLVDAMKKQNDHQCGRKGKVPFLKGKVKKTHPLEVRLKLILGPCRNLQILSQNLFNHCMGDATASLRANDRGFCAYYSLCLSILYMTWSNPQARLSSANGQSHSWTWLNFWREFLSQVPTLFISGSTEMSSVALAVAVRSALAIVVAFGVVGLRKVDEGQSGSLEMSSVALAVAVAVVVAIGVVGLWRVDEGQSGSPEMSSVALAVALVVTFGVVGLRRVDEG